MMKSGDSGRTPRDSKTRLPVRRRGFTFPEIMVVVLIMGVFMLLLMGVFTRFGRGLSQGTADLALQSDAQLLFRHLADDINNGQMIFTDAEGLSRFDFKADRTLVIIKTRSRALPDDPDQVQKYLEERDEGNRAGGAWPFADYSEDSTHQQWPMMRVVYTLSREGSGDKDQLKISRLEAEGVFSRDETGAGAEGDTTFKYTFKEEKARRERVVANHVKTFDLVPLAFFPVKGNEPKPKVHDSVTPLKKTLAVWDGAGSGEDIYRVAGVGIKYESRDQLQKAKGSEGILDVTTKLWLETKTLDFRYQSAFSTMDEKLFF